MAALSRRYDCCAWARSASDDMISEVMPLEDAPQAFERTAQKGVLKVLLRAS